MVSELTNREFESSEEHSQKWADQVSYEGKYWGVGFPWGGVLLRNIYIASINLTPIDFGRNCPRNSEANPKIPFEGVIFEIQVVQN